MKSYKNLALFIPIAITSILIPVEAQSQENTKPSVSSTTPELTKENSERSSRKSTGETNKSERNNTPEKEKSKDSDEKKGSSRAKGSKNDFAPDSIKSSYVSRDGYKFGDSSQKILNNPNDDDVLPLPINPLPSLYDIISSKSVKLKDMEHPPVNPLPRLGINES